jgi:hypothetical protein
MSTRLEVDVHALNLSDLGHKSGVSYCRQYLLLYLITFGDHFCS